MLQLCKRTSRAQVKVKVAQLCLTLCDPMDYTVHGILQARILKWVAIPLLQGIFPTQGSNPGLPHWRQILYHLSHQGSPRILDWVAYPFSSRSSPPRNGTRVSCIAGRCFTSWATWKAHLRVQISPKKACRKLIPGIVAVMFHILTTSRNLAAWILSCSLLGSKIQPGLDLASPLKLPQTTWLSHEGLNHAYSIFW